MIVLLAAEAIAADPGPHIEQARFFIKKQWYEDARRELERAVDTPDGRIDPEAWYMLATVRYELADLEAARDAAGRAHSYARDDDQLQAAAGLAAFLREQFGVVEVVSSHAGLTASVDIALDSVLFDPNLKLYLNKVQARHEAPVTLPVRIGLPAGTYRINGQQVTVPPAGETRLVLTDLGEGRPRAAQLAKAEVGVGMGFWFGADVGNQLPHAITEVSASQPVGPVVAGVLFDWSPGAFTDRTGTLHRSLAAWAAGARVGVDLPGPHLVVRPSIGWRYGYLPGIELACSAADDAWTCDRAQAPDLLVYAVGRAHVPFAELSVDWLDTTRKSGLGIGVKATGARAFGTLPARDEAAFVSGGSSVVYSVEAPARSWSATGVRMMVNVSLAF